MNYLDFSPMVDRDLLRELSQKDSIRSSLYLVLLTTGVVVTLYLVIIFPSVFTFVIAFMLIGVFQHHLLIVQHEAIHLFLFDNRSANEYVGAIASYLIGFTMRYRKHHFRHHRHLGEAVDPDVQNYLVRPLTLPYLTKTLLLNLSGIVAIKQFFSQSVVAGEKNEEEFDWGICGIVITQLLLMVLFYAVDHVEYYFLLWLLPLITLTKTITNFRNMAEHLIIDNETRYRTILCRGLEQFIFAPLNFNFHAEHHLCLSVPYQNLPKLHAHLKELDGYATFVDIQMGYISTIRKAIGRSSS